MIFTLATYQGGEKKRKKERKKKHCCKVMIFFNIFFLFGAKKLGNFWKNVFF